MPQAVDAAAIAPTWTSNDSFGLTLLMSFIDLFVADHDAGDDDLLGGSPFKWSPECIDMELMATLGVDVPPAVFDRLMTAIAIHTTNSFFVSAEDFQRMCVSLGGTFHGADTTVVPDCEEIAWAITEALLIHPPEPKDDKPFSAEIIEYISQCLKNEGFLKPPDVLRIGTHDPNLMANLASLYADEPEMLQSIQEMEHSRSEDVNHFVKERLKQMLGQIHALPMTHGSGQIAARMLERL